MSEKKRVSDLLKQADALISTSATKAELKAVAEAIRSAVPDLAALISQGFNDGDSIIRDFVAEVVTSDMQQIHKAHPELFSEIQSLFLSGDDEGEILSFDA